VDAHELELLFSRVHYENTVLELNVEGERAPVKVLVREVQSHAFRRQVLHVDFYQIHAHEQVTVEVPIRLQGSAPGVKAAGILMHTITDLAVRCLPDQIPEHITVDISRLEIGDAVHVRDLQLPESGSSWTASAAAAWPRPSSQPLQTERLRRRRRNRRVSRVIRRGKEEAES
jgi:large subunit ribosomal protein L25